MKAFYSVVSGIVVNNETQSIVLYETYDLNAAMRRARHEFTETCLNACQHISTGCKTICIINNLRQTTILEIKFNM